LPGPQPGSVHLLRKHGCYILKASGRTASMSIDLPGSQSRGGPMAGWRWVDGVALHVAPRHLCAAGRPLYHRRYRVAISNHRLSSTDVIGRIRSDPNLAAPKEFARFHKLGGAEACMRPGDEYLVHMPGPWDGPVRVGEGDPPLLSLRHAREPSRGRSDRVQGGRR
jgi:hypothetical protein